MRNNNTKTLTTQMTLKRTFILAMLILSSSLLVHAADLRSDLTTPVAVAGQVFDGGRVELASSGQSNLHSLMIDGREVALVFRHVTDRLPSSADATFLVRTDDQGVSHLIGITWTNQRTGRSEQRIFRVAAVTAARRAAPTVARLNR